MSFKVANMPSLFGKSIKSILPANARLVEKTATADLKRSERTTGLGFNASSFDLDGDGKADVIRRSFSQNAGTSFEFRDQAGNWAVAIALGTNADKFVQVITSVGSDITLRRDYDLNGTVDFEKKLPSVP